MSLNRSLAAAAALLCGTTMAAQGALLTFETLPGGAPVPNGGSVAAAYAAQGVTFNGGGLATQPIFRGYSSLSTSIAAIPAPPNAWFINTQANSVGFFDLNVLFSVPVFNASGDVVLNPAFSATVRAYDAADTLLATQSIAAGASTWISGSFNFSSATAIARINLRPNVNNAGVGLDNLSFDAPTTAVPEPSTFGAGLLLVFALGVRRYNVAVRRPA